jgi:UMF1 family MFS transporter
LGTITGATFAWLGGKADDRFGPKPVIVLNIVVLTLVALGVIYVSRGSVFGFDVAADSALPDIAFFTLGGMIGAAGGALQSASRSMMVRQSDPAKITESFGLYALTGKATSFIAPLSIAVVTQISGSQQIGITPLLVLFVLGLVLMAWVKPQGEVRA